jgi:hypothetical protein
MLPGGLNPRLHRTLQVLGIAGGVEVAVVALQGRNLRAASYPAVDSCYRAGLGLGKG